MSNNCDHEFSYEIDSWTGRGIEGTVICEKCGAIGGFTADLGFCRSCGRIIHPWELHLKTKNSIVCYECANFLIELEV